MQDATVKECNILRESSATMGIFLMGKVSSPKTGGRVSKKIGSKAYSTRSYGGTL